MKQLDCADPSLACVDEGGHLSACNTRAPVIHDDQGHTPCFGQPL